MNLLTRPMFWIGGLAVVSSLLLAGCPSDADVASRNLSKAADQFEIERRILFYNSIQDVYLLSIEGRCSIKADGQDKQAEVTCMTGPGEYKKHFLGISDNVTYFAEQVEAANVDTYHYRVIIKPETMLPDFDLETSTDIEGDG